MPATLALADCGRLITAVQEAGGAVPKSLTNILGRRGPAARPQRPQRPDTAHRGRGAGRETHRPLTELIAEAAQRRSGR